jgi:hypothetical protein
MDDDRPKPKRRRLRATIDKVTLYPRYRSSTYGLFLVTLGRSRLNEDFSVNLVSGQDLGAQLELDALLRQNLLELFATKTHQSKRGPRCACYTHATSSSMPAPPMPPRNSTTVTSAPSRLQTLPISKPMIPPPMTTILSGTSWSSSAPVELTICFSSI